MICSPVETPGKVEIKANRQLEESDLLFFDKYQGKQIGIELPGIYINKHELRIAESII